MYLPYNATYLLSKLHFQLRANKQKWSQTLANRRRAEKGRLYLTHWTTFVVGATLVISKHCPVSTLYFAIYKMLLNCDNFIYVRVQQHGFSSAPILAPPLWNVPVKNRTTPASVPPPSLILSGKFSALLKRLSEPVLPDNVNGKHPRSSPVS